MCEQHFSVIVALGGANLFYTELCIMFIFIKANYFLFIYSSFGLCNIIQ